ncbi:hypothetical protein [Oceanicoccus sp. KOV_DT_Chl]|uniref:hypothetical protein n=1 Tax=Oceanicoccus sp. KOV_DT_Chl TaxID=1904639 RepID=UPI000C7D00AD|nr:hypothetical protein [Oceanicoccus sp. KOV_DT_Chl]
MKQQVAVTYGKENAPSADDFIDKMLSKDKTQSVEKEWRCFITDTAEGDDSLWYTNKKFSTPELKAVYLGMSTSRQDRDAVIALVKEKYKNTKVYQAQNLPGRYEIDFVQVATR